MATKKKPTAKQLAARAKFVAMVRAKSKASKTATKKAAPKKHTVKKVSGLDKVVRRGKKTSVQYTRIAGVEKQYIGTYKVVRVFAKSGRKQIIEKGLTRSEAQRLTQAFPDNSTSMVVFFKEFTSEKYYK
jgi:hypothetical protein